MLPGEIYHIYNRGNNKENLFKERKNYQFFLDRFNKYLSSVVDLHAYCLMPNHFHLLVQIKWKSNQSIWDEYFEKQLTKRILSPVEKGFKNFFISYAKAINKAYQRTGSLFQYKFKRKRIETDVQYGNNIAYIHYNPIKAGYCSLYSDWEYSSYNLILNYSKSRDSVDNVLEWYGGKEVFQEYHDEYFEKMRYLGLSK